MAARYVKLNINKTLRGARFYLKCNLKSGWICFLPNWADYLVVVLLWWHTDCKRIVASLRRYLGLFLGAFAKLRKATVTFVMSVCPSAWNNSVSTGRILMKPDIRALFFFSKTCQENSNFIKIRQKWQVLQIQTFSHLWQYLAKFFLEREVF